MRRRRRSTALSAPVLALLLLAACGKGGDGDGVASLDGAKGGKGDSTATTLSQEEAEAKLLDWAQCMRGQGIDMPDPQVDDKGRVMIGAGAVDREDDDSSGQAPPDRDAFEKAREECGDPPAVGSEPTEEDLAEMKEGALKFAKCMRENGVEDFPDPDFSDMGPGRGPGVQTDERKHDAAEDGDQPQTAVAIGPFGEIDMDDPATSKAFDACKDLMGLPEGGPPMRAEASAGSSS